MPKQVSSKIIALTFGILAVSFLAAFYVVAWQEPTQAPPGGNVTPPLNVSSVEQTKTGNLVVNALGISATGNALVVPNGNVGIGTINPTTGKLVVSGGNVDVTNNKIINLATPTASADAANKGYVDSKTRSVYYRSCLILGWYPCGPSSCDAGYTDGGVTCSSGTYSYLSGGFAFIFCERRCARN